MSTRSGKRTSEKVNRIKQMLSLLTNDPLFFGTISEPEPLDFNPSVWVYCLSISGARQQMLTQVALSPLGALLHRRDGTHQIPIVGASRWSLFIPGPRHPGEEREI